jgi:hypothetical protein
MPADITRLFKLKEIILMSRLLYDAMRAYIKGGGKSRGSYLIVDSIKNISQCLKGAQTDVRYRDKILVTAFVPEENRPVSSFRPVRPIPESDAWFERVWREYREGTFF